jgi:hypothetical protein
VQQTHKRCPSIVATPPTHNIGPDQQQSFNSNRVSWYAAESCPGPSKFQTTNHYFTRGPTSGVCRNRDFVRLLAKDSHQQPATPAKRKVVPTTRSGSFNAHRQLPSFDSRSQTTIGVGSALIRLLASSIDAARLIRQSHSPRNLLQAQVEFLIGCEHDKAEGHIIIIIRWL